MNKVRAKKHLGQHFLTDRNIAKKIVDALKGTHYKTVLEIGAGMGILTRFLLEKENLTTFTVEIDGESVDYLNKHFPGLKNRIINADFLRLKLNDYFDAPIAIIGNFPYNISSQILFKTIENKSLVIEFLGMFQKEVAERITAKPGSKSYGIISVLAQAYYKVEYLFSVNETVFNPPPKVKSGVIRMTLRKTPLNCDEKKFKQLVKAAFNHRRKTLRNSLKSSGVLPIEGHRFLDLRAEQLSVDDFVELTRLYDE